MNETVIERSSLSFHALRAKFQSNNSNNDLRRQVITTEPTSSVDMIALRKKNSNNTMPRRITSVAKNISELSDHFSLKRNHSNNNSNTDLSTSKNTPSSSSLLLSSLNSSSTTVQDDEDDEKSVHGLIHSNSSLGICTVPRTGSFVTELSQRLEISEKKGEPVSQIIPKTTTNHNISLRKSAPVLNIDNSSLITIDSPPMFVLPPLPLHNNNTKSRKSVPTSASSPSLHIPPSIKRSTTGNSVHSIASSSNSSISTNQSSISNNKRTNWHFSQWFSHPPLPPSSTTTTITSSSTLPTLMVVEPSKPCATKRARVIQELISTERAYQADMELVKEIYYDFAYEAFSKIEIKLVFINLLEIIEFEKEFIRELLDSQQIDHEDVKSTTTTVGSAFSMMMYRMDQIYGDYCKKHEDAANKIQELSKRPNVQTFFSNCKEKMQGRTTCWDLPSLLIKPVQRVLKYPLLLKEIVVCTPEDHPDYELLLTVTRDTQLMADHINEIKRRKDMVEQLISDKKKIERNVVQNINKKFSRKVHRKKQAVNTHDTLFDELYRQFELRQEMARYFEKGVQDWVIKIKDNVRALSDLVYSLEAVYGESDGIGLRSIKAFKQLVSQLNTTSVEANIQESVYNRLDEYLKVFKNPSQAIQKRNRKLADYHRVHHLLAKGEVPDKQLQLSADQYISLNTYLIDELPVFISLTRKYFDIIVDEYARVQSIYWRKCKLEWKTLTIEQCFGKELSWLSLECDYFSTMKRLEPRIKEIVSQPTAQRLDFLTSSILDEIDMISSEASPTISSEATPTLSSVSEKSEEIPTIKLNSNNSKYDSLFSESQPVFQCKALVDYETPEKLRVKRGDIIQIWLPTSGMDTSDSATTNTESTAISSTEWWYGSLASDSPESEQIYGWLPSTVCEKM